MVIIELKVVAEINMKTQIVPCKCGHAKKFHHPRPGMVIGFGGSQIKRSECRGGKVDLPCQCQAFSRMTNAEYLKWTGNISK